MIFDYSKPVSLRRHGPSGYRTCESYRPWLRDEFCFRCVYCLKRETWTQLVREFEIDHVQPQMLVPEKAVCYGNLAYACSRCNAIKSGQPVSDPFLVLVEGQVKVSLDGTLEGDGNDARRLILQLDLNSDLVVQWRKLMMDLEKHSRFMTPESRKLLTGFPDSLPNLSKLRPKSNSLPDGVESSWFARRMRNELPDQY